ncbi:MAG: OmpA family protein [Desulfobacteraceae bacterium]|nr:OmpA family protein [Desulfobacteraceae bacterium]
MKQWLFTAATAVMMLTLITDVPAFAGTPPVPDVYVQMESFAHKMDLVEQEIVRLDQDMQWLENKINTMSLMGRPVPRALYQSVVYKQNRLAALEKIRGQYQEVLADLAADLPDPQQKDPDILSRDSAPSPDVPDRGEVQTAGKTQEIRESQAARDLMDQIQAYHMADWFEILPSRQYPQALVTTLPILFSSGSAVVAKEYQEFFKKISAFVKDQPMYIVVDGFADPDPIKTARYPSNFELGAARAANVIHALTDCGVDPSLFKAATTGKYRFPEERPVSKAKSMERYVRITLIPLSKNICGV